MADPSWPLTSEPVSGPLATVSTASRTFVALVVAPLAITVHLRRRRTKVS